jgi:hypothetical protein
MIVLPQPSCHNRLKSLNSFSVGLLDYWSKEPYPAYLVLYDAQGDLAYWLYIQNYLTTHNIEVTKLTSASLSLHIPQVQMVEPGTPAQWRQDKADVVSRIGGNLHA